MSLCENRRVYTSNDTALGFQKYFRQGEILDEASKSEL